MTMMMMMMMMMMTTMIKKFEFFYGIQAKNDHINVH